MDLFDKRLKPCPMCGSTEIAIKLPKIDDDCFIRSYYVKCFDCGLTGFNTFTRKVDENEACNRLLKYWNTRCGVPK